MYSGIVKRISCCAMLILCSKNIEIGSCLDSLCQQSKEGSRFSFVTPWKDPTSVCTHPWHQNDHIEFMVLLNLTKLNFYYDFYYYYYIDKKKSLDQNILMRLYIYVYHSLDIISLFLEEERNYYQSPSLSLSSQEDILRYTNEYSTFSFQSNAPPTLTAQFADYYKVSLTIVNL